MSDDSQRSAPGNALFDLRWIRRPHIDGIGRYTLELFRHLTDIDVDRRYLGLYRSEAIRKNMLRPLEDRAELLLTRHGLFSPGNYIALSRTIRKESCRFFIAPNYLGFPPRRNRGTIHVVFVHDLIPWERPEARRGSLRREIFFRCDPVARRLLHDVPDHIVAVSERTRAALVSGFRVDSGRISVIPGAPAPNFVPIDHQDASVLAQLGIRAPYLLYVGRGDEHKNLDRLIAAHRLLPHPFRERFPLVIVGTKPRGVDTCVHVVPAATEAALPALYRSAAALVLPSLAEGFGLPLVEAFACGTPVLASRIAPLTEIGGEATRYFDPEDVEEMARVVQSVLEDEDALKMMRRAALRQAAAFSWEKSGRLLAELLRKLDRGEIPAG